MRFPAYFLLIGATALAACSDSEPAAVLSYQYALQPPAQAVSVGQDSTVPLGVVLLREGTAIESPLLFYSSSNVNIARVDVDGNVTGLSGGTVNIDVRGPTSSVTVPVTVRPHRATSVELSIMSGPAGGLLATQLDTGTFYALPSNAATARLRAVVMVGTDTVFCNYCATTTPARVLRLVRFRSLDESLATVTNATNPTLQTGTGGTNTTGFVTAIDTASAGVRIVLEVPGDNLADTVLVRLKLRPIDSLLIRPDSAFFPSTNGNQGLQYRIWPNSDNTAANIIQSTTTNFNAGITFLSRTQSVPNFGSTSSTITYIPIQPLGGVTVRRANLPLVTWESANSSYLTVNAAGAVVGPCAYLGGNCPTTGSTLLNCNSTGGTMPAAFTGVGNYTIPNCTPTKTIPMPGTFCTTSSSTDLSSTCTIFIRATTNDQAVPSKVLSSRYRINVRR